MKEVRLVSNKIEHLTLLEIMNDLERDRFETYWWAKGSIDTLNDLYEKINVEKRIDNDE
jgi:hypothetical protein